MPSEIAEFQPRRFRSTVPFYARYRLGYPPRLIRRVADLTGFEPGQVVLDLGCGPGMLAMAFARIGARAMGVDPEPDMLAAARADAAEAGLEVDFREGSSYALPAELADVKLVTMGRSFHWMDRVATLQTLDGLVRADGAVVLFGEDHPRTRENGWRDVIWEVGKTYDADLARYREQWRGGGRGHESFLLDSAFSQVEGVSVYVQQALSLDEVVGRALSLSLTSPEKLGDRRPAFEADLRKALRDFAGGETLSEIAEMRAMVARRP